MPAVSEEDEEDEIERQEARDEMPPPEDLLLIKDFEDWAERVLSKTAWYYYRSAADEEKSAQPFLSFCRSVFFSFGLPSDKLCPQPFTRTGTPSAGTFSVHACCAT